MNEPVLPDDDDYGHAVASRIIWVLWAFWSIVFMWSDTPEDWLAAIVSGFVLTLITAIPVAIVAALIANFAIAAYHAILDGIEDARST